MLKKRIHCIVQARLTSSRLPGKIFLTGYKKSLIEHIIERLKYSKKLSKVIIATSKTTKHNFFKNFFKNKKIDIFYGDEFNVLSRYFKCAKKFKSDIIVRVTSDCPLIDYRIIDKMLEYFEKNKCDYLSNAHPRYYPAGLDAEIFTFDAIKNSFYNAKFFFDKEHVTPYIWNNPKKFNVKNFRPKTIKKPLYKKFRLTLDYLEDYILIGTIFNMLYVKDKKFSFSKIHSFLKKNPKISRINKKLINKM